MIISPYHKLIILLNMKTGSMSLKKNFIDIPGGRFINASTGIQHNVRLRWLTYFYPQMEGVDISDWRVVAFYRKPIERFLSGMAYHIERFALPTNVSVEEYISGFGVVTPQVAFLNPPNKTVDLFNFHDFANEVVRLAGELGYSINSAQVPKINESANRKQVSDLTTAEIERIQDIYAEDYAFFASKGIDVTEIT